VKHSFPLTSTPFRYYLSNFTALFVKDWSPASGSWPWTGWGQSEATWQSSIFSGSIEEVFLC
jgi:hypothetical protein